MYIHLLLPLSNQDCVPTLDRDSPKEDTLHDSQLVSSLLPDGWSANRKLCRLPLERPHTVEWASLGEEPRQGINCCGYMNRAEAKVLSTDHGALLQVITGESFL